jgi:hypothetical protein
LESSKLSPASVNISYIVPSDYNHDGILDVLVVGVSEEEPNFDLMTIYYGNLHEFVAPLPLTSSLHSAGHILALDADADLHVDLFGVSNEGKRSFWMNKNVSFEV